MDLEVRLFNPRRVICEAVKITEENYRQLRAPDRGTDTDLCSILEGGLR